MSVNMKKEILNLAAICYKFMHKNLILSKNLSTI